MPQSRSPSSIATPSVQKSKRKSTSNTAKKSRSNRPNPSQRISDVPLEKPIDPVERIRVLDMMRASIVKRKRCVDASHDERDRLIKRRKERQGKNGVDDEGDIGGREIASTSHHDECIVVLRPIRFPWLEDPTLEQPPTLSDLGAHAIAGAPKIHPILAMGNFAKLPTEIRDEIFRYNLIYDLPIRVLKGWSLIYPRVKPRLDLALLYTCKTLRDQGLRILFGENTFVYDMRDPRVNHAHTKRVIDGVFNQSSIPINQYGHLIRHIRICIPGNRLQSWETETNLLAAIRKFLPCRGLRAPANIHTLTLEVPAVTYCDLRMQGQSMPPDGIPICDILRGSGSNVLQALYRLQMQWLRVLATDREDRVWESVSDLRYYAKQKLIDAEARARAVDTKKSAPPSSRDNPTMIVDEDGGQEKKQHQSSDLFAKLTPPMRDHWNSEVSKAKNRLGNTWWRIQGLVRDPGRVAYQMSLWREVSPSELAGKHCRLPPGEGYTSLPPGWRDTPSSQGTASSSTRPGTAVAKSSSRQQAATKNNKKKKNSKREKEKKTNVMMTRAKGRTAAAAKKRSCRPRTSTTSSRKGKGREVAGGSSSQLTEDWLEEGVEEEDDDDGSNPDNDHGDGYNDMAQEECDEESLFVRQDEEDPTSDVEFA